MPPVAPSGWPSAIAPPLTFTFVRVHAEVAHRLQRDRGEGLVDLDEVDVGDRHAGLLQAALGGRRRAGQHDDRLGRGGRRRDDRARAAGGRGPSRSPARRSAPRSRRRRCPTSSRRGARARCGRRRGAACARSSKESSQPSFGTKPPMPSKEGGSLPRESARRARARVLVAVEGELARAVAHRDEAAVEAALLLRDLAAALALGGEARRGRARVKPSTVAIRSAEMPCGTSGCCSISAGLRPSMPEPSAPIGVRDIDSTPPPITRSCWPAITPSAAKFTACWPEPQKRFSVTPLAASYGQPAFSTAMRAMHAPCSPTAVHAAGDDVLDVARVDAGARGERAEALRQELLRMDARRAPRSPSCPCRAACARRR